MQPFPTLPEAPEDAAQSAQLEHRYDDLTQHGHIKLSALPLVLNRVCFDKIWTRHPLFETRRQGVFPILSRLVLEADPVPVSFTAPLDGRGRIQLAHERDVDNNVSALFMNTYGEIWGLRSRRQAGSESHRYQSARPSVQGDRTTFAAPAAREQVRVGRAFGEHVLTKPFGPATERKLLRFDVPGQPTVPSAVHTRISTLEAVALPVAAQPLDADFIADDAAWVFGLTHTDANQHVNSLVYVRCFEEAALRRLAQHGHDLDLLGKRIEINYRKPCFAGDRMICMLRSYACDGELGATGYLAPQGVGKERAHCSFRLQLRKVQS
jgi:hypothetical protein